MMLNNNVEYVRVSKIRFLISASEENLDHRRSFSLAFLRLSSSQTKVPDELRVLHWSCESFFLSNDQLHRSQQ